MKGTRKVVNVSLPASLRASTQAHVENAMAVGKTPR